MAMKTIRQHAKEYGWEIVGKLTRKPEWEVNKSDREYVDEAGNAYSIHKGVPVIYTEDGCI